jgi:hypothetical protein
MKTIEVHFSDGSIAFVHQVVRVDMDGPLVLYGKDDDIIAGWPADGWEYWKVRP